MFVSHPFIYALLPLALALPQSKRQNVLSSTSNAHATVYYDLTNSLCGNDDPFTTNWAVTSGINSGIPECESAAGASAKSLAALGTNQIVAINHNLLAGNPSEWCGKELVIYKADGTQFQFSEGPLIVWDGCAACETANILDLSAKAFTEIKGGTCGGDNPTGLTFEVLDTNIWQPIGGASSGASPSTTWSPPPAPSTASASDPSSSSGTSISASPAAPSTTISSALANPSPSPSLSNAIHLIDPATSTAEPAASISPTSLAAAAGFQGTATSSPVLLSSASQAFVDPARSIGAAAVSQVSPAAPATGGGCTYGAYQCSGLDLKVCGYGASPTLGWIQMDACATICQITSSGSVNCQ